MIEFSEEFNYSFDKEYSFLYPYSIKISDGFFQVYKSREDGMQELYGINILSKISYIKPQLDKKISKNKRDSTQLKIEIQNGGVVKNDNFSFLLASKYNYYLYETMFNNIPNIEIHVANTEADFKIAQIAHKLISQGIPPSQICIHSQDSDLLIIQTGVDIQQNIYIMKSENSVSDKLKYYYLHQSDYIQRTDRLKTIQQELSNPTTNEERQLILKNACETKNFSLIMSDILFQHFNILEQYQYYIPLKKEEIKNFEHVKLIFELYEQFQFNMQFQNIQSQKIHIQQNPYFQDVINDMWVNTKLSQKEIILKLYFQDQITYETLVNRVLSIEQKDIERRQQQQHFINSISTETSITDNENEDTKNEDIKNEELKIEEKQFQLYSSEGSQTTFE